MNKIAFAHPGRMGDVLYCLPTIKYICARLECKADFWTSEYCSPLKSLFEYQDYVDKFYVAPNYKLDNWGCGGQPWYIQIPQDDYKTTYQLGFRSTPDCRLDHFIGKQVGVDPILLDRVQYQYPFDLRFRLTSPYIILAPRGETSYKQTFLDFIQTANANMYATVQVGGNDDFIGERTVFNHDYTGVDFLNTCQLMVLARAFVGMQSSQLVLANGFSLPKIAMQDGISWDMRHVINSGSNYYPINPSANDIMNIIDKHLETQQG